MNLGLPQLIALSMIFIALGMSFARHGKVVKNNIIKDILFLIVELGILYWGGFFNKIGFAQITLIIILSFAMGKGVIERKTEDIVDIRETILSTVILVILLFAGNFF